MRAKELGGKLILIVKNPYSLCFTSTYNCSGYADSVDIIYLECPIEYYYIIIKGNFLFYRYLQNKSDSRPKYEKMLLSRYKLLLNKHLLAFVWMNRLL